MKSTTLIALSLVLSVFALFSTGKAISQEEPCFPAGSMHTTIPQKIRQNATYASRIADWTIKHRGYQIIQSKRVFSLCWVEIQPGWVSVSSFVQPGAGTSSNSVSISTESCYTHSKAYLSGSMNIRKSPTTNSRKVGETSRGESYRIMDTQEGKTYCWLKTKRGWIAHISYVSDSITDSLPTIEGNPAYVNKMQNAFQLIADKSSAYFNYTTPKIKTIVFSSNLGKSDNNVDASARMYVRERRMEISEKYIRSASKLDIAITIVHEACHVHQWDRGERYILKFQAEPECYNKEASALSAFSPGHPFIPELRCWADTYPSTFRCKYRLRK